MHIVRFVQCWLKYMRQTLGDFGNVVRFCVVSLKVTLEMADFMCWLCHLCNFDLFCLFGVVGKVVGFGGVSVEMIFKKDNGFCVVTPPLQYLYLGKQKTQKVHVFGKVVGFGLMSVRLTFKIADFKHFILKVIRS